MNASAAQTLRDPEIWANNPGLEEMMKVLTHELNQPLFAIANYAEKCVALMDSGPGAYDELRATLKRITELALGAGDGMRRVRSFSTLKDLKAETDEH